MRTKLTTTLIAVIIAALIAYSCQTDEEPIKVGTLLDSTGDLGIFGPHMNKAIDLAFQIVNDAGGVNGVHIETIQRDSGTSEQLATDAASSLVNIEGVNIIIGSISSGVTIAVAESVTVPGGKLLVTPASSSRAVSVLDDNDLVFRTRVSDEIKGVVTARLANELGYDNIATIYINNAYGESYNSVFSQMFQQLGGTVSAQVGHESGQASYISELERAADQGAKALLSIAYPESASVFLREAIEAQFFDDYLFVDVAKSQQLFDSVGPQSFEGSYGTAPGVPNSGSRGDFLDLYTAGTDGDPDSILIAEAFDAAALIALAIEKADSDDPDRVKSVIRDVANPPGVKVGPKDIARALELIRDGQDIDYVGAAGDQNIDHRGDVINTIEIWQIKDGKIASTGIFVSPEDTINLPTE